jgi:hypothetical protein
MLPKDRLPTIHEHPHVNWPSISIKKLRTLINIPDQYSTRNSREIAEELTTLHKWYKATFLSLDVNDLYVNIPVTDAIRITRFWLHKHNQNIKLKEQVIHALEVIFDTVTGCTYQKKASLWDPPYLVLLRRSICNTWRNTL